MPLRILLADDHPVVREGVRTLLEEEGHSIVGEASDGWEAVHMAGTLWPDVVVLDLAMPLLNGLAAAEAILKESPGAKIVLLTMYTQDRYVQAALQAGVSAYVLKSRAYDELRQALVEVQRGHRFLSPGIPRAAAEDCPVDEGVPASLLTPREKQVLQLIAEGKTTKEAAAGLGISVKTAETHRTRIMKKLDIHETAGLVRYAVRVGLTHL
jgi:DNA-binding NarL/FixJ family response regulator